MNVQLILILCLTLFATREAAAQTLDHKEHLKLAETFEQKGNYRAAAEQFALAYTTKTRRTEYAYRAAEYFYLIKDYEQAAAYFQLLADDYDDYPLAGLKYARCLKQQGLYELAAKAYLNYLAGYPHNDRDIITAIVETEVKGAEMARQEAGRLNTSTVVEPLSPGVNGPANELSPMPLDENVVYYISDRDGLTRMFRSDRTGATWSPGVLAEQFPVIPGVHIGSGALSPSGNRFYFSLCASREFMPRPTATCSLYVIVRTDGEWGEPQPLPPYINTPNNSSSTPFVYRAGEVEVMLFASDRVDGYGGMDLYRTERYLDSDGTDFSFPENLGPVINSVGDEVTPYYNPESQTLYFASNGYLNMGGYDIFTSRGKGTSWNAPENLKSPINSAADDYYYRQFPRSETAIFSSNRALPIGKSRTSNEDLFMARPGSPTMPVNLQILDSATNLPLPGVALAVFVNEAGAANRKLIASELSDDGYFQLDLPMGAEVELDAQRLDYHRKLSSLSVPSTVREGYQLPPFRMARIARQLTEVQREEQARTEPPTAILPTTTQTRPPEPAPPVRQEVEASEPKLPAGSLTVRKQEVRQAPAPVTVPQGRNYRVQIEARRDYDVDHRRYDKVRDLGLISSDYIVAKNLHRVLVGQYSSLAAAREALAAVQSRGYESAFIAAFDGQRYLGLAER